MVSIKQNKSLRKALIIQPGENGDIISSLPIAKYYSKEYSVDWLCQNRFHGIFNYTNYCKPYDPLENQYGRGVIDELKEKIKELSNKSEYELIIDLWSMKKNTKRVKDCLLLHENNTIFKTKYYMHLKYHIANVPFCEKWNLQWTRNREIENELRKTIVDSKYIVVHNSCSKGSFANLKINSSLPVIYFKKIKNYQIFDWYKVLKEAKEIHCVDSSLLNFVDSACISGPVKFFHDIRATQKPWKAKINNKEWKTIEYKKNLRFI